MSDCEGFGEEFWGIHMGTLVCNVVEGRGNEEGYGSQRGGEGGDMRARLLGSATQAHCRAHRSFEKSVRRTLRSLPQHKLLLLARPVRLADKLSWRDHPVQLFPPGAPPGGWWGVEERGVYGD